MAKLICCQCKKIICKDYDSKEDSHGYCHKCADEILKKLEKEKKQKKEERIDLQKTILDTYSIITNPGGQK
jgi:hypothetical protein